jgi:hypothetical protein
MIPERYSRSGSEIWQKTDRGTISPDVEIRVCLSVASQTYYGAKSDDHPTSRYGRGQNVHCGLYFCTSSDEQTTRSEHGIALMHADPT